MMTGNNWNYWYAGWSWLFWLGFMILMFSSIGNWGYTRRVHRYYGQMSGKTAQDLLDERYARGEITHEEYGRMKAAIAA